MSHGPAAEGSSAEPNLTPLLDVVLQLLMFFMMCVNFVTEQVSEDVKLPESASAAPMDKADTDVLFVNIKPFYTSAFRDRVKSPQLLAQLQEKFREGDPCVLVVGKDPMKLTEFKLWLRFQYEDAQKASKDGQVRTHIIIRADQSTDYTHVFQVLNMCKVQGYTTLKIRGYIKAGVGA
jgi:biopolymer transport protein ExbD